jgi:DNA-binding transcriptional regulator YhcF (GntR family)
MQKTTQSLPGKDGPRASADRIILIVQRLEEDIGLGRLRPRERLVEEELALRFGAKRHEVRQALAELDGMGIIVRRRNKGASVRDFSLQEVENIYAVRELLEGNAAEIIPSSQHRARLRVAAHPQDASDSPAKRRPGSGLPRKSALPQNPLPGLRESKPGGGNRNLCAQDACGPLTTQRQSEAAFAGYDRAQRHYRRDCPL